MAKKKEIKRKKLPCKWNAQTMYNFDDDGTINVSCAYGAGPSVSVSKVIGSLVLDDFYNPENNLPFLSYCDDFLYNSETEEIGCEMGFTTSRGRKRIGVYRQSLGDLFDVLFCIRFGGLGGKTPNDMEGGMFGCLLVLYRKLLDKEATGRKWQFLSNQAEKFQGICENAETADDIIYYIVNMMCLRKPKKS